MERRKLDEIVVTNPYLRNNGDIDSLINSIKTIGLINPLTINHKNELLAGGRRYRALKELGIKDVAVSITDRGELEQELISIDENLVRKALDKLEFESCLNRGREIYEKLNPKANKVDLDHEALTPEEKKQEREKDEQDESSFAAVTAEKLGLSKSIIKKAIKRDSKSSEKVKKARGQGDVSASQVNELIKLDNDEQDQVLAYVKDKSVKEVRSFVEKVKTNGLEKAIQASLNEKSLPKEFLQLDTQLKKCNKMISKLVVENFDVDHPELKNILAQVKKLRDLTYSFDDLYSISDNEEPLQELH